MPTYRITAPDGQVYRVTAPEGASEADVLAYAKKNYASVAQQQRPQQRPVDALERAGGMQPPTGQPTAPPEGSGQAPAPFDVPTAANRAQIMSANDPPDPKEQAALRKSNAERLMKGKSASERLQYGGANAMRSLHQTLRQFRGDDITEEVEQDRANMQAAGAPATAGRIATNISMTAVPAGGLQNAGAAAASQLAKAVAKRKLLAASIGSAASAGTMDLATEPAGEGETKLGNAKNSAIVGALMPGLFNSVRRVATMPFKPNKDAQELLKSGIVAPLSEATDNVLGRNIGRVSELATTAVDSADAPSRLRANAQTMKALAERATPPGREFPIDIDEKTTIRDLSKNAIDLVKDTYEVALKGKTVKVDAQFRKEAGAFIRAQKGWGQAANDKAQKVVDEVFGRVRGAQTLSASDFQKKTMTTFEQRIAGMESGGSVDERNAAKILRGMQEKVREMRDRQMLAQGLDAAKLRETDEAWQYAKRFETASADTTKRSRPRASDLNRAVKKDTSRYDFSHGESTGQDLTDVAEDLIGKRGTMNTFSNMGARGLGYAGATMLGGPLTAGGLYVLSRGIQSKKGQEYLLGQMDTQKALADLIRKLPGSWNTSFVNEALSGRE